MEKNCSLRDKVDDHIGYIKFVDQKYIEDFLTLDRLWLSNVRIFMKEGQNGHDNLYYDSYESRTPNLELENPAYISCFTILRESSFDKSGKIDRSISESLLSSEKALHKSRGFIYIPKDNMIELINIIKYKNLKENAGYFTREIKYLDDYKEKATAISKEKINKLLCADKYTADDIFKINEKIGTLLLATKPSAFEAQHEYRIGKVLSCRSSSYNSAGFYLELGKSIKFANHIFEPNELSELNLSQLLP